MSLYETLGIPPTATTEEIKAAGKRAQKRTHPDAGGKPEEFTKVTRALAVLRDPGKRASYDKTGAIEEDPANLQEAQAFTMLVGKFQVLVQSANVDPRYTDITAEMRHMLREDLLQAKANKAENEKIIKRLAVFQERLSAKEGKPNRLAPMLVNYTAAVQMALQQCEAAIAQVTMALEMLDDFIYRVDRPEPWEGASGGMYGARRLGGIFDNMS